MSSPLVATSITTRRTVDPSSQTLIQLDQLVLTDQTGSEGLLTARSGSIPTGLKDGHSSSSSSNGGSSSSGTSGETGSTSGTPVAPQEWDDWISAYSSGKVSLGSMPTPPDDVCMTSIPEQAEVDPSLLFGTMEGLDDKPMSVKEIWEKRGYLRATLGPNEVERRRVLTRFDLRNARPGRESIDRVADMAQAFFHVPIVVVSVVLDDREIFTSTIGWDPSERAVSNRKRIEIPLETALCPHAMQSIDDSECFILMDAAADWRFAKNPYVANGGPIAFFASANIRLPTVQLGGHMINGVKIPAKLPVGSICIVDTSPRIDSIAPFTETDRTFLKQCADMIAREIELAFQQTRQSIQHSQTAFTGEFLRSSLVNPGNAGSSTPSASTPTKEKVGTPPEEIGERVNGAREGVEKKENMTILEAVEELKNLMGADEVVMLDLRGFVAPSQDLSPHTPYIVPLSPKTPSSPTPSTLSPHRPPLLRNQSSASPYSSEASKLSMNGGRQGSVSVLASSGSGKWNWEEKMRGNKANAVVGRALREFALTGVAEFDSGTIPNPMGELLPRETSASITLPIFDHDGQPALLMVVVVYAPYFRFEPTDRQFVENIGGIAIGGLLRRRILEADRAKLAFVSQVTHELLTPLHGVRGQLDLIRTVVSPSNLKTLEPLLDVADICVSSLREILDDTLVFSKMTNSSPHSASPTLTEVNLQSVVEEVIKACWSRNNQMEGVGGGGTKGESGSGKGVDLVLDWKLKEGRWKADVGGLKRLLFNLIGNSLKFTSKGSVTIIVREDPSSSSTPSSNHQNDKLRTICIDVIDTGCGMSQEFIRDSLFVPFKQHDSFIQGTGLGVSICDHIIKRMHGTLQFDSTLGTGTTASITLPLELIHSSPTSFSTSFQGPRIISAEMARLFQAGMSPPINGNEEFNLPPASMDVEEDEKSGKVNGNERKEEKEKEEKEKVKPRVLVIDDNPIALKILTTFLSKKGVDWAQAVDGTEGVELFKSFKPHLVWTDIEMPKLNGVQAAIKMREIEKEEERQPAHISALSGVSSDAKNYSIALADGTVDEWIVKGGPSLKTLGAILSRLEDALEEEEREAEELEERARQIRLRRQSRA